MRIMALDIGEKYIGVAVSDELCITAQGLENIRCVCEEATIEKIKELIDRHEINEVVLGFPLNMDGSEGKMAKRVIQFFEKLKDSLKIPVKLWDERLSTVEGEKLLIKAGVSKGKRKKNIDKLAAQIILTGYLNSLKR